MSNQDRFHRDKEPAIQRLARGIASAVAECTEAHRMLFELRMNPDHYVFRRSGPADTYADFLFRTSGTFLHEPSAHERASGQRYPQ